MTAPIGIDVAFRGRLGRFVLDARFTAPATGVTGLFGPSGCGKTTVLRAIAGLQQLGDGFCSIGGDVWQDRGNFRPAYKRPVGYVFQEASLFPHLSVLGNLQFGVDRQQQSTAASKAHFAEAVGLLGLERLLDRSPKNLSGGERQRVAIGRALLSQPRLLLMDEPLSALDRQTKDEILPFLERLHAALSLPVIYVSHDIAELEQLADFMVLMQEGRVIAAGRLSELQSDLGLPLALGREAAVSLDATVTAYDPRYGLATLAAEGGHFSVPMAKPQIGDRHRLKILAKDVSLAREPPQATTILNIFPAVIRSASPAGQHQIAVVLGLGADGEGSRLLAHITRRSWDEIGLAEGMRVYSQVKGVALARS